MHLECVPASYIKALKVLNERDKRHTPAGVEILPIVIAATDRGILPCPIEASKTAQPLAKVAREFSACADYLLERGWLELITSIGINYHKGREDGFLVIVKLDLSVDNETRCDIYRLLGTELEIPRWQLDDTIPHFNLLYRYFPGGHFGGSWW